MRNADSLKKTSSPHTRGCLIYCIKNGKEDDRQSFISNNKSFSVLNLNNIKNTTMCDDALAFYYLEIMLKKLIQIRKNIIIDCENNHQLYSSVLGIVNKTTSLFVRVYQIDFNNPTPIPIESNFKLNSRELIDIAKFGNNVLINPSDIDSFHLVYDLFKDNNVLLYSKNYYLTNNESLNIEIRKNKKWTLFKPTNIRNDIIEIKKLHLCGDELPFVIDNVNASLWFYNGFLVFKIV